MTDERPHEIIHRCPPQGSGIMPCCGRTPTEVSRWHRMTLDDSLVTCGKSHLADSDGRTPR